MLSARHPEAAVHRPGPVVPSCAGLTMTASYLAESTPGAGPGFLFRIENHTAKPVTLAQPVPSSAHWYAHVGGRWLWRASAGRGGALVDAIQEKGPMFAYQPATEPGDPHYMAIPAHGVQEWTELMRDHPAIDYRPSCAMCNYPGEDEYRAVFAYAYLPHAAEHVPNLLTCGLRSNPVVMPLLSTTRR
ncbi:hypothetical protein [Paracidobacterium acidisoli]|nr:hypothetical protein [Paracidobacterium acidisoli]MBT9330962.1 hypothetical protein [Paracidobacterium acidisoli]